jgi:hypothetical protein
MTLPSNQSALAAECNNFGLSTHITYRPIAYLVCKSQWVGWISRNYVLLYTKLSLWLITMPWYGFAERVSCSWSLHVLTETLGSSEWRTSIPADLHEAMSPDTHSIRRRVGFRVLGHYRERQNASLSQKPNLIIPSVASRCTDGSVDPTYWKTTE